MTYWKQIPISEPPEVAGIYHLTSADGKKRGKSIYSIEYGWHDCHSYFTHYLVPVTDEEIKKIASDAWDAALEIPEEYKQEYLNSIN
jgi:hypothetical protein